MLSDDGGFDDRIRSAMRNQHRLADLRQEVVVIDGAREQTLPDIRRDAELWARALVARPGCDSPDGSTTRHTGEKIVAILRVPPVEITHARHVEGRYHRRCWATCSAELRSRSHFKSTGPTVAGFMRAVTLRDSLLRCPI